MMKEGYRSMKKDHRQAIEINLNFEKVFVEASRLTLNSLKNCDL